MFIILLIIKFNFTLIKMENIIITRKLIKICDIYVLCEFALGPIIDLYIYVLFSLII